jgi:hypothetical protein
MRNGRMGTAKTAKAYGRALRVLARMRRTEAPLTAAAHQEHVDPRTVRKYLRADLKRIKKDGQTRPTKSDRRRRNMLIPTALGTSPAVVKGSRQATLLGRYMSVVGKYLRTGDTTGLSEFEGKSISGHTLLTDPSALSSLAEAGALQLEGIYSLPESAS